jgi:hypothetical protein
MHLYERQTKSDTDIWVHANWYNWAIPIRVRYGHGWSLGRWKEYKRIEIQIGPFKIVFGHGKVRR